MLAITAPCWMSAHAQVVMVIILHVEFCISSPLCLLCRPGEVAVSCRKCVLCPEGFYSTGRHDSRCTPCTPCLPSERTVRPCTRTHDTICKPCDVSGLGYKETCDEETELNKVLLRQAEGPPSTSPQRQSRTLVRYDYKSDRYDGLRGANKRAISYKRRSPPSRRVVRSLTDSDTSRSDEDPTDSSRSEAPSGESNEQPLERLLEEEDLFVYSTRRRRVHVTYVTLKPDRGDDLETGSGQELVPSATASYELGTFVELIDGTPDLESGTELLEWTVVPTEGEEVTTSDWADHTELEEITELTSIIDADELDQDETTSAPPYERQPTPMPPEKPIKIDELTEDKWDHKEEVLGDNTSGQMSNTAIIVSVIVVLATCGLLIAIFVFCRRRQKRRKQNLQRNGEYKAKSSDEDDATELDLLDKSRDKETSPEDSTEMTPLKGGGQPEADEDVVDSIPEAKT